MAEVPAFEDDILKSLRGRIAGDRRVDIQVLPDKGGQKSVPFQETRLLIDFYQHFLIIFSFQCLIRCRQIAHLPKADAGSDGVVEDVPGMHQDDALRRADGREFILRDMEPEVVTV